MKRADPAEIPIPELHGYLTGGIGPRPIALASTIDAHGRPNLSPFSFFNAFGANPGVLIFSPARRGRDNTTKHSFHNVKAVPEVVINAVTYAMVQQVSVASGEFPEGINEFEKSGLTPLPSEKVRPFRVKESPVQFECKVMQVIETGTGGGAANLVVCEVVMVHVDESVLGPDGKIDQHKIDLVGRMGGATYCRAHGDALFELTQPNQHFGVGVDALPAAVRNSTLLTGNQLGKLASWRTVPDETSVNEYKLTELADLFITLKDQPRQLEQALHARAGKLLDEGRIGEAWQTLLTFNDR
ncbi:MAG TPA: flavin reductase family protein [Flavobacteriales bacterium]|nr:flavin reductase family protein [Flavobacteriales bacterium]HRO40624.1 flavin reductase family protein [Flavobacteriales bacterium]HRP82582.1 flavin reductase family protein [Flavobacteriales bacterium]